MSGSIPLECLAYARGQQQHAFRVQPDEALRATMNFVSKKVLASSQEVLATGVCSGCLFVCLLYVPAMKKRTRGLFQEGSVQTQTIAK